VNTQTQRYPFQKSRRWRYVRLLDFFLDPSRKTNSAKPFPEKVEKILVVRLDHIGDLICSTPVLPVLKERFPNAKITLLTGKEGKAVFKENPLVNELIVFHTNWFSRAKILNPIEFIKIVLRLRKEKFDLGYDLRGDIRNIFLMSLGGVKFRIGYEIAGGAGLLHRIGEYDNRLHQAELNLKLLTNSAPDREHLKPKIYISGEERQEADELLSRAGIGLGNRAIAIHPEAGYPSKEWDETNLNELIERLIQDPKNKIILLGLKRAKKIAARFKSSEQVIDLVGRLSLRQMIAVISRCSAFIGNDSGPSHIAQALEVPALVIASGTNEYHKWGIWRQPSRVISNSVSCAPCQLTECNVAGHPCMAHISSDQAYEEFKQLLSV